MQPVTTKPVEALVLPVQDRIQDALGYDHMLLLAELLEEVLRDTQFGDVKIVIAEGRVVGLRAEKSYK